MERVRRWVRAGMRGAARDESALSAARSALVLAPHPDDETLGCGATILRKVAASTPVTVAVLTDGRHSHRSAHLTPDELAALRRAEMAEAGRRLGLADQVRWGGFADGSLADQEDAVVAYIVDLVAELRPAEVYATCAEESHPDHAALGRAARRAVGSAGPGVRLLEYPVWLWHSWPVRRGDRIGSAVDAAARMLRRQVVRVGSDGYLDGKLHTLQAHASQLRRPEAIPAGEPWPVLPGPVLAAASDRHELFLPWLPG